MRIVGEESYYSREFGKLALYIILFEIQNVVFLKTVNQNHAKYPSVKNHNKLY